MEDWCKQRLAGYKRPRRLAIVDELPRNPSGKVLKNQLRTEHSAGRLISEF
ncbi:AMP-binding enzyme [Saccharopolyspora sp. NPDC000995]